MKKLFILLFIAAFAASCEGPMGPMGPQGPSGSLNKVVIDMDELYVREQDWKENFVDGEFINYYYDFNIPELTAQVFDTGFYYTYWVYNESQVWIQEGDGATMYKRYVNDQGQFEYFYSETIKCDYTVGHMRVNYYISDFEPVKPKDTFYFRFVAFW